MCFNGVKTYQLGWYLDYHLDLPNDNNNFNWNGDLVGFAERDEAGSDNMMIIKIRNEEDATDTYIHFNRETLSNSGTKEAGNEVLVTARPEGLNYQRSWLEGKYGTGGVHMMTNFKGSGDAFTITVNSINLNVAPA